MIKERKYFVGGYRKLDQPRYGAFGDCDWFATNLEMPSRPAAVKWMKEKLKAYAKYNQEVGFSYYETHSVRGEVEISDGKILIK